MTRSFLITGGAGFIGTNLVSHLVQAGQRVIVVDDLSAGDHRDRLPAAVEFHRVDIRDTAKLTTLCRGVAVVVHLAALPQVQRSIEEPVVTHEVNVNGTLSVLEAARAAGVSRVVYAASSAVYGDQQTLPLSIDLPPQPKSPYALQKYMGEVMMRTWSELYGLETVSLRFFNVYGRHMDPTGPYASVIGRFIQLAKAGQPLTITGDGTQTRDFVHVTDVVGAIVRAATVSTVGAGEVCNVGTGQETSVREVAALVGGDVTYTAPRVEPSHSQADISNTIALLGWQPRISLARGIAELKNE